MVEKLSIVQGERRGMGDQSNSNGEDLKAGREKEELWGINNRPNLSKASLMGCDRNLFTLRLVLNQMQGEWLWQAAVEG